MSYRDQLIANIFIHFQVQEMSESNWWEQHHNSFNHFFIGPWVSVSVPRGLTWAYLRAFWGPTTPQNDPIELKPLEYVLVWVREQNRVFIMDFWLPCNFSPVVVTFHHTPQTAWLSSILWLTSLPHSVPKWLAKNRPSMKSLVHYISHFFNFMKMGVINGAYGGLFQGILRSYNSKESSYGANILEICFGVGTGTK